MTTYNFSTLTHDQRLAFEPETDFLSFDSSGISATAVRLARVGDNLSFSHGGKTVWLDGMRLEDLSADNVPFANGSALVLGDGSSNPRLDWYGAEYTLGGLTDAAQIWGLGGADLVNTGSGSDWLVGNVALTALNHVSRSGAAGSPTSSSHSTVSADGSLVAFAGGWTSFGSTNNNGQDVFVKNMGSGAVSNEHRNESGQNGGSGAGEPVISADGKVLAFTSASALTDDADDSGALYDIFLADVAGNGITMVSTGTGGTLAADGQSGNADLSFDGSSIVFESDTSNWAAGGSTNSDIFLKDLGDGSLTRISTSLAGTDGNGESLNAQVSADGRYVVFESDANNLTSGDTNGYRDIFLWDRDAAGSKLVNLTEGVTARNQNNTATNADIAYDEGWGGVVVFQTAKAFVDADTANNTDIYCVQPRRRHVQLGLVDCRRRRRAAVQRGGIDLGRRPLRGLRQLLRCAGAGRQQRHSRRLREGSVHRKDRAGLTVGRRRRGERPEPARTDLAGRRVDRLREQREQPRGQRRQRRLWRRLPGLQPAAGRHADRRRRQRHL